MTILQLIGSAIIVLSLTGCDQHLDTIEQYSKGSVEYTIEDDESIHIKWTKVHNGEAILSAHTQAQGRFYNTVDLSTVVKVLNEKPRPVIAISKVNITEVIEIDCTPELRTSDYTTYQCQSIGSEYIGYFTRPTQGDIYLSEELFDENGTMVHTNVITSF